MRMLLVVAALAGSACKKDEPAPVVREVPVEPEPPPRRLPASTAEDEMQLLPDEQARYDQMVEGTSNVQECNEMIRQLRKLASCKNVDGRARTFLQRGALMMGELGGTDTSGSLKRACSNATKSFSSTLEQMGC